MSDSGKNKGHVIGDSILRRDGSGENQNFQNDLFISDDALYQLHETEDKFFDLQKAEWEIIKMCLIEDVRSSVEDKIQKRAEMHTKRKLILEEIFSLKDEIEQINTVGNMAYLRFSDSKEGGAERNFKKNIDLKIYKHRLKLLREQLAALFSGIRWATEFILENVPGFMEKPQSKKMMH